MWLICWNIWKWCCVCWNFCVWSDAFRLWISFDFFQKTFFPKFELLNLGCDLSAVAAYLQVRLICGFLRYQPSLKKKPLSDKGLTLIMSDFKTCYGGQFTWSTQLMKSNYHIPPMQHHRFCRNVPPSSLFLFIYLLTIYIQYFIHQCLDVIPFLLQYKYFLLRKYFKL